MIDRMSQTARTLLDSLIAPGRSPDMPVKGAPEGTDELVRLGYLRRVSDRYEVSARAWQKMAGVHRTVRVRGLTPAQAAWCSRSPGETGCVGNDEGPDVRETVTFGGSYVEGDPADLGVVADALDQMYELLLSDPYSGYALRGGGSVEDTPEWMLERINDQAAECCETAAGRIRKALEKSE